MSYGRSSTTSTTTPSAYDNLQLMAYLAATCPNIDLGTAAVVLPRHDPLRVAERAIMVDLLSKGRLRFGMGRGLARRKFHTFRGTMGESRERLTSQTRHRRR
jgi:alkanesulfonate monooxygenase SsuD/methylene tetrahydromethanopterin reductase-like flavin-dependent oxidoreductase (luciferase family)